MTRYQAFTSLQQPLPAYRWRTVYPTGVQRCVWGNKRTGSIRAGEGVFLSKRILQFSSVENGLPVGRFCLHSNAPMITVCLEVSVERGKLVILGWPRLHCPYALVTKRNYFVLTQKKKDSLYLPQLKDTWSSEFRYLYCLSKALTENHLSMHMAHTVKQQHTPGNKITIGNCMLMNGK